MNAPTAGAANRSPTTSGPRWNCVMARNVNRACGIPKIIAMRSITNVDWINRFRRTNANPSLTAAQPVALPGSRSGGIGCIRYAAKNSAPYVARSIAYAVP